MVLAIYFALPWAWRNGFLLLASLLFYAWGERAYTLVLAGSIGINYGFGLVMEGLRGKAGAKGALIAAVGANLALLGGCKYLNFAVDSVNPLLTAAHLGSIEHGPVHLPLGISFFTFHALSYLVDVYRGDSRAEKNPGRLALYVTLFPQLIAGPILRYHQVAGQFLRRRVDLELAQSGLRRFLIGFGKKVLIANTLAAPADKIFGASAGTLSAGAAWMGVVCYTLQIYFDFSGYSDMAIGLGRIFGFRIPENFDYPYISRSIKEFWRRWHISLSFWFRDYVYIPLGGNRVGVVRHRLNLLAVFLLCGVWHGAAWSFIAWGLWHGVFILLEGRWLSRLPGAVARLYTMAVVAGGWVLFRCETLSHAGRYFRAMVGSHGSLEHFAAMYLTPDVRLALVAAAFGMTPYPARWARRFCGWPENALARVAAQCALNAALMAMFVAGIASIAAGTYNPFIYFRF
ncbi:MAG: MBOAT family O-acyltransferase [Chthoniobacteraceae bacterium]